MIIKIWQFIYLPNWAEATFSLYYVGKMFSKFTGKHPINENFNNNYDVGALLDGCFRQIVVYLV